MKPSGMTNVDTMMSAATTLGTSVGNDELKRMVHTKQLAANDLWYETIGLVEQSPTPQLLGGAPSAFGLRKEP
jgi:hypothetical protein